MSTEFNLASMSKNLMNFIFLQLGYFFEGKELDDVFWRFKSVAEKKKVITRIIPFDFMVVPFPGSMKQC